MKDETDKEVCPDLHIYAQDYWHGCAYIVGNVTALVNLRNAIDSAIATLRPSITEGMAGDGEGYWLFVVPITKSSEWFGRNLALPYVDDSAAETRDHVKWPQQLEAVIEAGAARTTARQE